MSWFLGAVGFILLLPVILLIPRIRFWGRASSGGVVIGLSGAGFRFGFDSRDGVGGRILFFRLKPEQLAPKVKEAAPEPPRKPEKKKEVPCAKRSPFTLELSLTLIRRFLRLLRRLLRSIHADYLRASLIVASPDPMITGVLFGALQPIHLFNSPPRREFNLAVDFERDAPEASAEWSFSARPIQWVWILLTWGLSLPWLEIWRQRRRRAGVA